jgi:hypothetical protein
MSGAAVFTLILVVVAVLVIAGYLTVIALALSRIDSVLRSVNASVDEIPYKTKPIAGVVGAIDKDLADSAKLLEGLLQSKGAPPPQRARGARV